MNEKALWLYFKARFKVGSEWWRPPAAYTRNGPMRTDIFGVFDAIRLRPGHQVEFYQITTAPNRAARRRKIQEFYKKIGYCVPRGFLMTMNTRNRKWTKEKVKMPKENGF